MLALKVASLEASLHEKIKQIERPLLVETVGAIARGDINLKELVSQ